MTALLHTLEAERTGPTKVTFPRLGQRHYAIAVDGFRIGSIRWEAGWWVARTDDGRTDHDSLDGAQGWYRAVLRDETWGPR